MKTLSKLLTALVMSLVLSLNLSANDDASNPCGALLCILGGQTSGECKKYYNYYAYELPKNCKGRADCIQIKQMTHLKNCKLEDGSSTGIKINNSLATSSGVTTFTQNLDSKISQMSGVTGECTEAELNRVEKQVIGQETVWGIDPDDGQTQIPITKDIFGIRINPQMTKNCSILANGQYSTKKVTYTCPTKEFYTIDEWNKGFKSIQITKAEYYKIKDKFTKEVAIVDNGINNAAKIYNNLPQDEKGRYNSATMTYYKKEFYKKVPVNNKCWKVEDKF